MLIKVLDLLQRLREGITKKQARITIEEYNILEPGDGLRFKFVWYEEKKLGVSFVISLKEIHRLSWDENILIDRIIRDVNTDVMRFELNEQLQEKTQ